MPLDPLQDRIAHTALALPQARTLALAGGGAMIVHGFVSRATKDIDLFTEIDDTEAIQVATALRNALHQQGLTIRAAERPPADHRFVVIDPATSAKCTVEVFPDGGRLHRRVTLDIGPVLHTRCGSANAASNTRACGRAAQGTRREHPASKNSATIEPCPATNTSAASRCPPREVCRF